MADSLTFKYEEYEKDFDKEKPKSKTDIQLQYITKEGGEQKNQQQRQNMEEDAYEADFDRVSEQETPKKSNLNVDVQRIIDKNPDREKMIEQNIKLKTQIYELAKQMDQIMQREKKQKKYGIHADQEQDEVIKAKKAQLKKQQIQIMSLKNKIFITKRQLEHVYDSRGIQGKEDELKNLQIQLKTLQEQKDGLLRVKKEQMKALKLIRNDKQYEEKIKHLKEQLAKTKQQCKNLSEKLLQNQRILRKNHQIYIIKQSKIKQMQNKIKENKEKNKKSSQQANVITTAMIEEIDQQIMEVEKERKEAQKAWNEKIQIIEAELAAKRLEQEKKLLILKQKQKELKLNEIRIKELKKLIQHHTNEPSVKQTQQSNMREFRHKRNIKHLQK